MVGYAASKTSGLVHIEQETEGKKEAKKCRQLVDSKKKGARDEACQQPQGKVGVAESSIGLGSRPLIPRDPKTTQPKLLAHWKCILYLHRCTQ